MATFVGMIGSIIMNTNAIDRIKREKLQTLESYMNYLNLDKQVQIEVS